MPSRFWRASGNALLPGANTLGPAAGGGAVWASSTTWNTASDPTATCTVASFWSLLFALVAKTASSVTFTVNALPGGAHELYVGLTDGTETLFPGNGNNIGVQASTGNVISGGAAIFTGSALIVGDVIVLDWSDGVNVVVKKNGTTLVTRARVTDSIPASLKPTASAGNISGAQITLSGW